MGKASSAKKVARAAGMGGSRAYGARPPYMYYFAVVVLVLLGVIGVWNSREYANNKVNQQGNGAPKVGQSPPWYEGFAVDVCGKLLPPIKTDRDPYGITTNGEGIITISPTVKSAAGHNATLGKFATSIGLLLNASELQVPGGKLYQAGDTCEGKSGSVYVMVWTSPQAPQSDGILQTKKVANMDTCNPDCNSGVLLKNNELVTVAFLPTAKKGETPDVLQPPPSVISKLTSLVASAATTTVPTTAPVTTTTVATGKATTPTAAKSKATTTVPTTTPAKGHKTATTK
jgi:hypothetical protein